MSKLSFDAVWQRILAHEGEEFHTITGLPFTYIVEGNIVNVSRTEYSLHQKNFEIAFAKMPVDGPGAISEVRGPSYVWAVLHDPRITPR